MRIKKLISRVRQCLHHQQDKKGSSLGLVVIIGAALVIWVLGILPMMTASGTTAIDVQLSQDEYLADRASIEFCKSELYDIVRHDAPYSFAVIDNGGRYSAIPRLDSGFLNPAYQGYVAEDTAHPENDVPESGEAGKDVTAICTVSGPNGNRYDIRIVTYHEGSKNMSYRAVYTMAGSLKIYPEAYKQSQALPLSDFVLVDGKLGSNTVWNATLSSKTVTEEHLLAKKIVNPFDGYANAGEYPAVLKVTALPAKANEDGEDLGGAIVEEPFDSEVWILPYGPTDGKTGSGALTFQNDAVYLDGQKLTAGTDYKLFYNGSETLPKKSGKYVITVDYNGSGAYKDTDGARNYLPVKGIVLGEKAIESGTVNIDGCKMSATKVQNGKVTVTIAPAAVTPAVTSNTLTQYGYSTVSAPTFNDITWGTSNTFTLDVGTYYFFCYSKSGYMTSGGNSVFYPSRDIRYCGVVFPFTGVEKLTSGEQYMVVGASGSTYYAMGHTNQTENNTLSSTNLTPMAQGTINSGVLAPSTDQLNALAASSLWTMSGSENTWNFSYNTVENGKTTAHYLNLTGDITQTKKEGSYTNDGLFRRYQNYTYTNVSNLNIGESVCDIAVNINNRSAVAYRSFSKSFDEEYQERGILSGWKYAGTRTVTKSFNGYLTPGADWSSTDSSKNVYFVKLPGQVSLANLYSPGYYATHDLSTYSATASTSADIIAQIKSAVGADSILANGTEATSLNAGVYDIVAEKNDAYCLLGKLTVSKDQRTDTTALSVEALDYDVTLSAGAFAADDHGLRYFGYRITGANDYNWINLNEASHTFRLPYSAENETYDFAVYECGTVNVVPGLQEQTGISLVPVSFILPDNSNFTFTLGTDADGNTIPIWYKTLPSGVNENGEHWQVTPSKITMRYAIVTNDGTTWFDTYQEGVNHFGIYIRGSQYDGPNNLYEKLTPVGVTSVGGYQSSTLSGSSIYLMGTAGKETIVNDQGRTEVKNVTGSLDTKGNDIYLTTDLLVLNDVITGSGHVYVYPYTPDGDGEITGTLVFFRKTYNNFIVPAGSNGEFYLIPSGTDLTNVSSARAAQMACTWDTARIYFRQGNFPEINLDIAFATAEQLDHIKSGETMGWTVGGNLKNSDTNYTANAPYAVCAYVNQVTGSRTLTANRILIAAKDEATGSYTMKVPSNMTVVCRYFSVDAEYLIQGASGVKLTLMNLGQNQNLLTAITDLLGISSYNSRTLQMDYERYTYIQYAGGGEEPVEQHICRYEDNGSGVDIFTAESVDDLMVTYTIEELEDQFDWLGSKVQTVDRYIRLTSTGDGVLNVSKLLQSPLLKHYANYIYVDPTVKTISMTSLLGRSGEVRINTQEMGYTAKEYLGIFSHNSAENYSGTILYVSNPNGLLFDFDGRSNDFTLSQGFYYIPSSNDGTSVSTLKGLTPLTAADLAEHAVYINEDGSISDAYVDTGIYDNDHGIGDSGFSGGGLE